MIHFLMRSVAPIAAAITLLLPLAASAQRSSGTTTTATGTTRPTLDPGLRAAGLIGFEWDSDVTGLALRGDVEKDLALVGDRLKVAGVLSLGFTRFSEDIENPFGDDGEVTTNIFKLVPAARLILPATPQLDLYGDLGLGLYYASSELDAPGNAFDADDSETSLLMRIGVGGRYQFTDALSGVAEVNWNPYFGDLDARTLGVVVGVGFRF